jgi:ABC-type transport system involved in cytochrome c biogenesis permease subunit
MSSLSNVHIFCFAASYAVALVLEVSRLFFRAPVRIIVTAGFAAAGLLAHTAFVVMRANPDPRLPPPLSSWFDWLLLVAWGMAGIYLLMVLRRPQAAVGIFMLPVVLVLIGVAALFRHVDPFPRSQALYAWGMIHGVALLLGSIGVMLGFVAGVMYLLQSYRLKQKLPPRQGLKLPSLEWLQQANKRTLLVSSCLLAAGLLAGVVANLVKRQEGIPWTDPVVWTSGLLFVWLVVVLLFESLYKPAQQGRKVAYLTVASFVLLGLVLGMVLLGPSEHATSLSPDGEDAGKAESHLVWTGEVR